MKIRSGFVSNSSSSSFVVAFDKLPKHIDELQKTLFGDEQSWSMYDYKFDTRSISEVVLRDIRAQQEQLPYSIEELADDLCNEAYQEMYYIRKPLDIPGMMHLGLTTSDPIRAHWYEFEKGPERDAEQVAQEKELQDRQEAMAKEFMDKNKGKVILRFVYSDNDGKLFTVMEHGDIFQKLSHVRISNH